MIEVFGSIYNMSNKFIVLINAEQPDRSILAWMKTQGTLLLINQEDWSSHLLYKLGK